MSGAALIVGLGNPGPEYERTRHNLGFRVVERLCERLGARLRPVKGVRALAAEARDGERRVVLAQPTTYMNLSGEAVGALVRSRKTTAEDVIVVHDELDLPLGTVRVKLGGGDGGHNGVASVSRAIGRDFARVRIGIGRPSGPKDPTDWVLEPFSKRELDEVAVVVEEAADAVLLVAREGVEGAQNLLHGEPATPAPVRKVRKQADVDAPLPDVWEAWTTEEGARTFFAPAARIVLEEGGAYEILFNPSEPEGSRGAEGCTVASFEPERRLTFSWTNPPSIPAIRWERTKVSIALRSTGAARTRVTLTHAGFGDGEDWDRALEYFERAWDIVLERLQRRFRDGPVEWGRES